MADGGRKGVRAAMASAEKLKADELSGEPHLSADCPVTPLGLAADVRFYLDCENQLIALAARDHSRLGLQGLFGRGFEFLYRKWPRVSKEGDVVGWRPELAAQALMAACADKGVWDPGQRERGRGAWRGDDGELILHLGDRVLIYPASPDPERQHVSRPPGLIERYVYPTAEHMAGPAPAETPGVASVGEEVLKLLETWAWRRGELDAVLMLGWVGAAIVGGALNWRPCAWVTGGKATGKSTLQGVLSRLLGDAVMRVADASAASIWQTLKHQTLPVVFDELEAEEDNRRVLAVVKLARLAASGGKMARGGENHRAVEFTIQSCFLFSSILMPPLLGQDRSRIAVLELRELEEGSAPPSVSASRLRELGTLLRRRMVTAWPRLERALAWFRAALAQAGHSARGADQFGTLLACADVLLFDNEVEPATANAWIEQMRAAAMSEVADDMRDEERCLQHMLTTHVDPFRNGVRSALAEWITRAAGRLPGSDEREAQRVIGAFGLAVRQEKGGAKWLAVANYHAGLAIIFAGTHWAGRSGALGVWVQALRRLPGAERTETPIYFGGGTGRATLLPLELVPRPEPDGLLF